MLNFKMSLMSGVLKETENNGYSINLQSLPICLLLNELERVGVSCWFLHRKDSVGCIVQCSVILNLILKFQV